MGDALIIFCTSMLIELLAGGRNIKEILSYIRQGK